MGSGASNGAKRSAEEEESQRRRMQLKVRVVGVWSKFSNWRQREADRIELRKKVEELKKDKEKMYAEIDKLYVDPGNSEEIKRRQTMVDEGRTIRDSDRPLWAAFESDTKCYLCKQRVEIEDGYPCRICTRIFHATCLANCGECRQIDRELCHRARSNTGWSCYICGNLGLLLTEDEMNTVVCKFDEYDFNQDTFVSREEFLRYRSDEYELTEGTIPSKFEKDRFDLDFRLADVNCDGNLDWWEFINYEAQLILMKRPKDALVDLLTEKELLKAKSLFRTFDSENNGFITEINAKEAYRNWYKQLEKDKIRGKKGNEVLEMHVNLCAKMLMQMGDCEHECIFWADFLDEQALYFITSRPNQADIFRRC